MVEHILKIEDVLIKKGEISLYKETSHGSSSKNKYWKYDKDNNKIFVNDGLVDNIKTKAKASSIQLDYWNTSALGC